VIECELDFFMNKVKEDETIQDENVHTTETPCEM
jgi:hypothetical protein